MVHNFAEHNAAHNSEHNAAHDSEHNAAQDSEYNAAHDSEHNAAHDSEHNAAHDSESMPHTVLRTLPLIFLNCCTGNGLFGHMHQLSRIFLCL